MRIATLMLAAATLAAVPAASAEDITGDAAAGKKVFNRCKACHVLDEAKSKPTGPHLVGIINRPVAIADGFKYSKAMTAFAEGGTVWDVATMSEYLAAPKKLVKGTRMAFPGLKKEADIANVIAYLNEEAGVYAE